MRGRAALVLVALAACGHVGFDGRGADDAPPRDGTELDPTICDEVAGVLLCESFEGASQLPTEAATPPSLIEIDSTRAYRGQRALHARVTRPNEPAWRLGGPLGGLSAGELHARLYLYLPASPVDVAIAAIHLVSMVAPFEGVVFGIVTPGTELEVRQPTVLAADPAPFPRDRWTCVQLRIVIADVGGVVESWIDGVPGPRHEGVDTAPAGGYTNVHAGIWATSASTATTDLWTDELVVGTSPIPCD